MKKILSLILAAAMLFSLGVTAAAEEAAAVHAGDTVTVTVVSGGSDEVLQSIGYYLYYDETEMEFVEATSDFFNVSGDPGEKLLEQNDFTAEPTGFTVPAGEIAELTFKVLKDDAACDFELVFEISIVLDGGAINAVQPEMELKVVFDHTHVAGEVVEEDGEAATCCDPGYYYEVVYCTVCGEELSREPVEIPATGEHVEEVIPGYPATCGDPGLTDGVKCAVSGKILVEQEVIPATGDHHYGEDGICTVCGAKEPGDDVTPVGPGLGEGEEEEDEKKNPFTDVKEGDYFYDAVIWAVENGITTGVTPNTFAPLQACTRAQVVTFLWRAAGSPEPTVTTSAFTDVVAGSYYEKAVLWAVEKGITTGITETTFAPEQTVTREQFVTFLWRYAGKPTYVAGESFSDVVAGAYYADAIGWAAANGITKGMGDGTFGVGLACNRAQTVTFIYRFVVGE